LAWTYDATNLSKETASGRLNAVRFLVGDTDTNDQQVQDEEITFALSESNNQIYYAAAWTARGIASKYSRLVTIDLDGQLREDYSDLASQYYKLADDIEYQGKKNSGALGMVAGGIDKATVDANRQDTTRVQPSFWRDQFKNPPGYSPNYDYGD